MVAFIVLGLVLLAAGGGGVLRANMPTAKLSVHAVRPTGENFNFNRWQTRREGKALREGDVRLEEATFPVWEVAVTNTGSASAYWQATLALKDGKRVTFDERLLSTIGIQGSLPPGQSTNITVPIAAASTSVWAVAVRYDSPMKPLEVRLHSWLAPVPILPHLLPNNDPTFAYDAWHVGTNVTTAH